MFVKYYTASVVQIQPLVAIFSSATVDLQGTVKRCTICVNTHQLLGCKARGHCQNINEITTRDWNHTSNYTCTYDI